MIKMNLRIFNSGSQKREKFKPLKPGTVKIYVCGVTPYDTTHMGHAFTYVSFDVLIRYLKFKGFKVIYTQNVTDIDDDVLGQARAHGKNWKSLGGFWTKRYLSDMKSLNVLRPTHYVKATGSIPQIIGMIGRLAKKGFAYESGGNVYFDVKRFPMYGRLSHFTKSQMKLLLKERGGDPDDPNKRNPLDFILWQKWKSGEPFWSTPWGNGRPGWHIECSAMINRYLGDQIDIHGGGRDLIFPHHESEIAQSESFTGKSPLSRYFVHTAMVMFRGEKMSKSLGNLVLVSDLLKRYSPNAIRWMLLSHGYRQVWEYVPDELDGAASRVKEIESYLRGQGRSAGKDLNRTALEEFSSAMEDDLNSPEALRVIGRLCESGGDQETARLAMKTLGFFV